MRSHPDSIARESRERAARALHTILLRAAEGTPPTLAHARKAVDAIVEVVHDERGRDALMDGGEELLEQMQAAAFDSYGSGS
jgi:hypothetical protein